MCPILAIFPKSEASSILDPRASSLPCHTKSVQPKRSEQTQANRQRLARPDGARNRASGQDNGGKQRELDTVGVAVLDAQTTEDVKQADGYAGCDGGN